MLSNAASGVNVKLSKKMEKALSSTGEKVPECPEGCSQADIADFVFHDHGFVTSGHFTFRSKIYLLVCVGFRI